MPLLTPSPAVKRVSSPADHDKRNAIRLHKSDHNGDIATAALLFFYSPISNKVIGKIRSPLSNLTIATNEQEQV